MRKYLLILGLLLLSKNIYTETWAPIGATWYYTEQFFMPMVYDESYIKMTSEKDTTINNIICKKIIKNENVSCTDRPIIEYMYSNNDTVFFYDPNFEEFQILYNFNAQVSESWNIKVKSDTIDTIKVTVNSIDTVLINEIELKQLNVTYEYHTPYAEIFSTYNSKIIESIGDIYNMFNFSSKLFSACDGIFIDGLRCYSDSRIGSYKRNIGKDCEYVHHVGINNINKDSNIDIYPNPANNEINIKHQSPELLHYKIIDLSGKLLLTGILYKDKIDISSLNEGLYIIEFYNDEEAINIKKRIIKTIY